MIWKIPPTTDQDQIRIRLQIRNDLTRDFDQKNGLIQVDVQITPLYCAHCKKQLEEMYQMDGSRYGQVGSIQCSCGATIHCVDADNIVEYLETHTYLGDQEVGSFLIDFLKIYRLETKEFLKLRETIGFDIFQRYPNKTIELRELVQLLETEYGLEIGKTAPEGFGDFKRLPQIVHRWFAILDQSLILG